MDAGILKEGVRRREVLGWAMYDFANSGYTTVVLTAVFNAYFVGVVAGNASWATLAWTAGLGLSNALLMLVMPVLGAWVDLRARKKRALAVSTAACVFATLGLYGVGRGDVMVGVMLIVVSNFFYGVGESLTAAFLPELATEQGMGRVSGWGWSFGYFGGMLTLGLSLAWVISAQARGETASQFVPVTMAMTGVIYGLASLPTFLLLRERARPVLSEAPTRGLSFLGNARDAARRLRDTWRASRHYRDFSCLMACGFFYQAGIAVVIALAAVYAEQVLGFKQTETMALVFLVNIAAAVGAFGFGYVQDRVGHKLALRTTLVGWVVMTVLAYVATERSVFWGAAVVAGLCMGSSQSAGRAMVGVLAPVGRQGEFFGLWTLAVRLSSIVGPMTYGLVTWMTAGNHRLAILSTALFFVVGALLVAPIDMVRGRAAALAIPDPDR